MSNKEFIDKLEAAYNDAAAKKDVRLAREINSAIMIVKRGGPAARRFRRDWERRSGNR